MKNKVINISILIILGVFISLRLNTACTGLKEQPSPPPELVPIDIPAQYSGLIPVPSTPGMEIILHLDDETFLEARKRIGRHENYMITNGKWSFDDDTLHLRDSNGELYRSFLVRENNLMMIDQDQNREENLITDQYNLKRLEEFESVKGHHERLKSAGIIFVSSGNEPFWNIQIIGENNEAKLTTPESEETMNVEWVESNELSSNTKGRYISSDPVLEIEVKKELCQDTMSGILFTHTVYIHFNEEDLTGCGTYL